MSMCSQLIRNTWVGWNAHERMVVTILAYLGLERHPGTRTWHTVMLTKTEAGQELAARKLARPI